MIIGLEGFAGVGKDFYGGGLGNFQRLAFADVLKSELDAFLQERLKISAFTKNKIEKEIIRPILVCWGTEIRRKQNQEYWIDILKSRMNASSSENFVITDVRYLNEAKWILNGGGRVICISRPGIGPANEEEKTNSPKIREMDKTEHFEAQHLEDLDVARVEFLDFLGKI
jgi:hypothetical protein